MGEWRNGWGVGTAHLSTGYPQLTVGGVDNMAVIHSPYPQGCPQVYPHDKRHTCGYVVRNPVDNGETVWGGYPQGAPLVRPHIHMVIHRVWGFDLRADTYRVDMRMAQRGYRPSESHRGAFLRLLDRGPIPHRAPSTCDIRHTLPLYQC